MSLYKNINARKKAGTSRTKAKSTVTKKAYSNMKAGFPKKKKGAQMNTPCVGICRLNDQGICLGCFRTIQQIKDAYNKDTTKEWQKLYGEIKTKGVS